MSAKSGTGRRVAVLAGSLLLAGAVVGGAGYTVVTVQGADRDPGTPTWDFPERDKAASEKEKQGEPGSLRALFLPYGEKGYERGPDMGEFGNDSELGAEQAVALRKESLKGFPRNTRKQLEKEIDKQHIKGVAMRSYLVIDGYRYDEKAHFTADVTLTRMENRDAVRRLSATFDSVLASADIFREGPVIKGHKGVRCFLTPKGEKEDVEGMYCSAYVGEVLVSLEAAGPGPLRTNEIADFLAAQLDRIDDPGQAV